jgi:hypothetical protein
MSSVAIVFSVMGELLGLLPDAVAAHALFKESKSVQNNDTPESK